MMRELGDKRDLPDALAGLGRVAQRQGDLGRAAAHFAESLAVARATGDQQGIAQRALSDLGTPPGGRESSRSALTLLQEALVLYHAMGDLLYVAASLEAIAVVAGARGEAVPATRLLGAAAGLLERVAAAIPRLRPRRPRRRRQPNPPVAGQGGFRGGVGGGSGAAAGTGHRRGIGPLRPGRLTGERTMG